MKKIIFVFVFIILITGCHKNYEKDLKKVSNDYYNNYVKNKVIGISKIETTLGELRTVKGLDLSSVKSCKNDTKIILTIEKYKIVKYEFEQHCN